MAINPELITTIRVDQLPDEALSLTNLFPHTVGTDLKSATIQELVDLVATAIGVSGGVGFIAISVTDGQQLPDVPELPSFFLCGAGTFLNINGYPDVICTDELNAVMSLSDHWQLAVGIPIVAEVGVQSVTGSAVDNTDPLNPVINLGSGTPTLQEVLDNNHDLVDGNNFQGTGAGVGNTGTEVNALGISAAANNVGNFVNGLGNGAGMNNEGINVNALGTTAAFINAGNNVNALGDNAAFVNAGNNVNALGNNSGSGNAFNDVNLFGANANADEDGQTVLSKDGTIMARISTTDLTSTQKYNLPDASGTIALTSDITIPTLQQVTDVGNETINSIKARNLVTQTNGPTKSMILSSSNVNSELTAEWQDKNYMGIADITDIPDTSTFVPYTGATTNVNLGTHSITAKDLIVAHPSGSGDAATITKGGSGEALKVVKSSGSGNAASITGGVTLLSELHLNTDLADAYIASAAVWNAKQDALVSGTNIKTINGASVLGSGDLVVSGGVDELQVVLLSQVFS